MTDIPNFDTAFPAGVDIFGGVTDGDGAHNLTVVEGVDGPGMSGDTRAQQSIGGERYGGQVAVAAHVETVCSEGIKVDMF